MELDVTVGDPSTTPFVQSHAIDVPALTVVKLMQIAWNP
jgi:hypothetical protein